MAWNARSSWFHRLSDSRWDVSWLTKPNEMRYELGTALDSDQLF